MHALKKDEKESCWWTASLKDNQGNATNIHNTVCVSELSCEWKEYYSFGFDHAHIKLVGGPNEWRWMDLRDLTSDFNVTDDSKHLYPSQVCPT